ncbi:streptomycin 6-kinase [Antricoccus suffuscus]|uniref:Streptomycin 6-kinase n=2 Tax=Antricoccus suffuscus TaxID=1629062 RepID=A0A2T0ZFV0_9ACTN|nr:streptomycin 6-kinase [Antricoccus suffuscus]
MLREWDLTEDGAPMHGFCSLVIPVRAAAGQRAVLKLGYDGDDESQFEHLALQGWHGSGAVQLLRAEPGRRVMLLERLKARDLRSVSESEACDVVAGLYPRLHVPAHPQLRSLTSYVERWANALNTLPSDAPVPRRLVGQAVALAGDFVGDERSTGTTIHGDLHFENVLAGDREPWLAIDPKPMSGDPHYEVAPMLWNRWDELVASGDVRSAVQRRFYRLVDGAGLDPDRARDWVVVRMVLNAYWAIEDAGRARTSLSNDDQRWITRCIAIAKAVQ